MCLIEPELVLHAVLKSFDFLSRLTLLFTPTVCSVSAGVIHTHTHSLLLYMHLLYINIHLTDTSIQSDMQTGNATAKIHTIYYTINTNFHHCFKKVRVVT